MILTVLIILQTQVIFGVIASIRQDHLAKIVQTSTQLQHMSELDVNLPSTRQTQGSIKDKIDVSIKLLTGDVFVGKILWQDPECLFFADTENRKTLISRRAIAYIQYP